MENHILPMRYLDVRLSHLETELGVGFDEKKLRDVRNRRQNDLSVGNDVSRCLESSERGGQSGSIVLTAGRQPLYQATCACLLIGHSLHCISGRGIGSSDEEHSESKDMEEELHGWKCGRGVHLEGRIGR